MSRKKLVGVITAVAVAMTVMVVMVVRTPTYTLSVIVDPPGAGWVSPSSGEYKSGTQITLTASPAGGYAFEYWTGGMFETAPTAVVTIYRHMEITARFTRIYTLTTNIVPSEAGSVSPSAGQYRSGSQVILTATAASGYAFDHWGVSLSDTASTKVIVMDSDKGITAHFAKTYNLTTDVSPPGAGSVFPWSGEYKSGTQITLEALPARGYIFDRWSGDASGRTSPRNITMDSDKAITAHFRKDPSVTLVPVTFTGSTDETTAPFTVTTREWVIDWSYVPHYEYPALAVFGFFIYRRGETVRYVESVVFPASTRGTTYSYAGPGDYYVKVYSGNVIRWQITIRPA